MSKADEMFEKFGYMIFEDDYKVIFDDRNVNIIFDKETKTINTNDGITLNLEELQAINEKVKELGWNE